MHRLLGKLTFCGCNPAPWMLVETAGVGAMLSTSRGDHLRSFGGVVALEQVPFEFSNKRERISRKERVGVVETFVQKYMPLNQGKFPSISTVIRETGGSWRSVKEILNELESRLKEESAITDELSQNLNLDEKGLGFSVEEGIETLDQSSFEFDTNSLASSHRQETVRMSDGDSNVVSSIRLEDARSLESSEKSTFGEKADLEDQVANLRNAKQSLEKYVHAQNTSGPQQSVLQFSVESHSKGSAREKVHPEGLSRESSLFEDKLSKKSIPEDGKSDIEKMSDVNVGKQTLWERLHAVTTSRNQISTESEAYSKVSGGSQTCTSSKGGEEEDDSDFTSLDYPQSDELKSFAHKLKGSSVQGKEAVVPANVQPLRYEICVRYLSSDATEADLREAFQDCGGIIRAQPIRSAKNRDAQLAYGFVCFDSKDGFRKALRKEPVIRGTKVTVFPSTSTKGSLSNKISQSRNIKKATGLDDHVKATSATPGVNHLKSVSQHEGYPVKVENVPSSILSKVKEALQTHGEILSSYYKANESGNATALINFKSEESKENALAMHWVYLGGEPFRVSRLDSPKTTVVRISNISHDTGMDRTVNACKSCGYFQKIEPRANGVVDVYFHPKESGNMIRILDRLNEVHMDKRRWQARPAPRLSAQAATEFLSSADGQEWIKSQQCQVAEKLETSISKAVVHMEDLKNLLYLKWHGKLH